MVLSLVCLLGLLYPGWPETVGVVLNFFVLRYFCVMKRKSSLQKSNNLKRLDEMSSKGGLTAMALARTLPYFPSGILTALGAVSRMSARDYIIANLIGKFPSTALEVVVGHDVVNFRAHMDRLAVLTTLVIIVYGDFCTTGNGRRRNRPRMLSLRFRSFLNLIFTAVKRLLICNLLYRLRRRFYVKESRARKGRKIPRNQRKRDTMRLLRIDSI